MLGSGLKITLGGLVVVILAALAISAPVLAPFDPLQQDLLNRIVPPVWADGGSWEHPLGTDNYGRDVLSRLIHGSRISILVGFTSMLLSCTIGTFCGVIAAYRGGRLGAFITRFADAHLAFPEILLAILIVATLGGGLLTIVMILGISSWMVYARVIYGLTLSIKERPFIEAVQAQGASGWYIVRQHILPHLMPIIIVISTLQVAQMILTETALSFLGLGIPPPTPSWGNVLAEGRDRLLIAPWIANSAGIAIIMVVWGINMLGNGLREKLDPNEVTRG
ncbi:ABC transporter permease [uncultured Parasphingorhabdus sp.]|uniref:ABC transporter permease n=1 Tax=uncultured Parasphingorhabdus sp. TaxID=2709694 RepID=UPI002AA95D8B|nr:ABC transporter permease [uncultured Parasphingorhabdus sp.]